MYIVNQGSAGHTNPQVGQHNDHTLSGTAQSTEALAAIKADPDWDLNTIDGRQVRVPAHEPLRRQEITASPGSLVDEDQRPQPKLGREGRTRDRRRRRPPRSSLYDGRLVVHHRHGSTFSIGMLSGVQ